MSTNNYFCKGCDKPAHKEPVVAAPKGKDAKATLGSWRCTASCKGKVKVRREKAA